MFYRKILCRCSFLLLLINVASVFGNGLPGEYLLTQRWRDMISSHSPLTNAAFLTEENYTTVRVAFAPILQNQFKLWEAGITQPVGLYQSLGLSMIGEDDGTIVEGTFDGSGQLQMQPGAVGKKNQNFFFMGTYAWNIWSRFSVGANLNYAYQSNFGEPKMGIGFDVGLTYRLLHHPLLGDHLLGLATQNLIAPTMSSTPVPELDNEGTYSRGLKLSLLSYLWEHRIESALHCDLKDFLANAKEFEIAEGLSNAQKLEWTIDYRLGVWMMRIFQFYTQVGFDQNAINFWGVAGGINVPSVNNGRDLQVLYQFNMMTDGEDDNSHTVYVKFDIGKHREEVFARKMARLASLSPNELYNKARKLYSEQKYWDAFFIFSRIMVEYPDFFKNDWVKYYRSNCEEELDMRDMAIKNYSQTKVDYPLSAIVPYSDLGLMRIYYRNGDFSRVANQFIELSKPNVPDSLKFHGAYLLGQAQLQSNDLAKAIQVFSSIPESHPDFVFAQHAIAIAHAKLNDDPTEIVTALENCISVKAQTEAQKEIINRSYVFLGYLFYEENSVSKAVVALRMIPTTSFYGEDALLGQAWTSLKARQWPDCIAASQLLLKTTNKPVVQCEAMLLQAYGYLLQKQYPQSLELLKTASGNIKKLQIPSEDSLSFQKMQNESNRTSYQFLAEKVENISQAGQSTAMIMQLDSMHMQQENYIKKFNEYYSFSNFHHRNSFFCRNIDAVKEDVEYALATVQKILGQSGVEKVQVKMQDKQKELDSEIDKLKKEMDKLQQQK